MMSGIFDQLQSEIEKRQPKETGISPADLLTLPPAARRVIRLLLREGHMSYPLLQETIDQLPAPKRLNQTELDEALIYLTQEGWVIQMGQDQLITYKVNLRHKPGSKTTMWSQVEKRLSQIKTEREDKK